MQRNFLLSAVAASLVVGLAACGSDGNGGPSFSDSVSTADAQNMATGAVSLAAAQANELNFALPSVGEAAPEALVQFAAAHGVFFPAISPRFAPDLRHPAPSTAAIERAAAEGCTFTEHGTVDFSLLGEAVDLNQNGIPDDFGYRLECLTTDSTSHGDTTVTDHFVQELSIQERMGDLYGFDGSFTYLDRTENSVGLYSQVRLTQSEHLSINAGNANTAEANSVTFDSKIDPAIDPVAHHSQMGSNWSGNFAPTTATIVLGDPLPDGELSFTGRMFVVNDQGTNLSFSLTTPFALDYNSACYIAHTSPPFDGGVIEGHLNNNGNSASFSAAYAGCGIPPLITINGAHDPSVSATP